MQSCVAVVCICVNAHVVGSVLVEVDVLSVVVDVEVGVVLVSVVDSVVVAE